MSKNLVIVESPAKAKTIETYLGKEFTVKSSFGHVRDLPESGLGVDVENAFEPTYEISSDKKKVIAELKKLADNSDVVWLASDDDREGEAIAWHLKEALDLKDENTRRIVFREITKTAIQNAIQSPRGINIDLVNAQQARRVLDRLVGFELSPVLWKKIKRGLSAGRVQSVAVRLIVEREREIESFKPTSSYKISVIFSLEDNKELKAELKSKIATLNEAKTFVESCVGADFKIKEIESKPGKKSPSPPFTTSTLQQEASRKLGFSVSRTMTLAQKLYESGKITYMRTDSYNLSDFAIQAAADEIGSAYGKNYVNTRHYKTKKAGAQEAHEAIRPTDFSTHKVSSDASEQKLYDLIWKRAIASQMADAKLEKTNVSISNSKNNELLYASGEVVIFDGFLKVYTESKDDDSEEEQKGMLPPLKVGQNISLKLLKAEEKYTKPAPRYTEASLVSKLEEMGIGRPSTYAPTISTIQKRQYVVKEDIEGKEREISVIQLKNNKITETKQKEMYGTDKKKLIPTDIARVVNDFLVDNFPKVIDYSFTAKVEEEFDTIASGKLEWKSMLSEFYSPFHTRVTKSEQIERKEVGGERELGTDPKSGKKVVARIARFGPVIQIGEQTETEKPKYANLRKGQHIESITLEEALDLFQLPKNVGNYENEDVIVAIGKFGPYVKHGKMFVSIPKTDEPLDVTIERAIELIENKKNAVKNSLIKEFSEDKTLQVLNGRYGAYIKHGTKNVRIPKDKKPEELTFEECIQLSEATPVKKTSRKK